MVDELEKGKPIKGEDRAAVAAELAKAYTAGASIRELAKTTGRSYGFVRGILVWGGVTLRRRGGDAREAKG